MRCEDVQAHLPDHLAHALAPPVADAVAGHLETCVACAAEYEAVQDTWQRLALVNAPTPDSAAMRIRFQAALDEYQNTAPAVVMFRKTPYVLQFAAAAAILILGIFVGRQLTPPPAQDPQLAELRSELRSMREMVTMSLLQQESASERLKGITWSRQIDQPGNGLTQALLDTLMHDPNPSVRLASIDALKRFAEQEGVRRGAVEALSQQTSPLVQMALIDFVIEVNDREAADTLRRMANDAMVDEAVRARAARGLAQMG